MSRLPWPEYYLGVADAVSKRGDCVRRQVGAVVVSKANSIVSTGYNGSAAGKLSCMDGGCPRAASSHVQSGTGYAASGCVVIHAETNAIIRAGRDVCLGSTIYVTDKPCDLCAPLIEAAGIEMVVYRSPGGYTNYKVGQ